MKTTTGNDLLERYMEPLLAGRRQQCCHLIRQALSDGLEPRLVYDQVLWPAMEQVERLYRQDSINLATEHMATRINRLRIERLSDASPS